jgi:hypothetical protein
MSSKTYHVMPGKQGWVLRKAGTTERRVFTTQREAIDNARKYLASAAGQIVIHNADGKIRDAVFYKLPKIQSPPMRGGLKARKIEKAVTSIVLDTRLSLAN